MSKIFSPILLFRNTHTHNKVHVALYLKINHKFLVCFQLKIQFNESLTSIFEYPSESSMLADDAENGMVSGLLGSMALGKISTKVYKKKSFLVREKQPYKFSENSTKKLLKVSEICVILRIKSIVRGESLQ